MPFGTMIASQQQNRLSLRAPSQPLAMDLLCDGGCRPNPGVSQPLVHDGSRFLPVPARPAGTNHQAVYDAVDYGLQHAIQIGATDLNVYLLSRLVWGQLTNNHGVVRLMGRRNATLALSGKISKVTWILIAPPLTIGSAAAASARALRRLAARSMKPLASSPSNATWLSGRTNAANTVIAAVGTAAPVPAHQGP